MNGLFVIVMTPCREYIHLYYMVVNLVNQTMLIRNLASPLSCTVTGELFRFARSSTRVHGQLIEQLDSFLKVFRLVGFQHGKPLLGFNRVNNLVHDLQRIEPCVHFIKVRKPTPFAVCNFLLSFIYASEEFLLCHQRRIFFLFHQLLGIPCQPPHELLTVSYCSYALP